MTLNVPNRNRLGRKTFFHFNDLIELYDCFFYSKISPSLLESEELKILAFEVLISRIRESWVADSMLKVNDFLCEMVANAKESTEQVLDVDSIRCEIISIANTEEQP